MSKRERVQVTSFEDAEIHDYEQEKPCDLDDGSYVPLDDVASIVAGELRKYAEEWERTALTWGRTSLTVPSSFVSDSLRRRADAYLIPAKEAPDA